MVLSSALESMNIGALGGMAALTEFARKNQQAIADQKDQKE